MTNYRELLISAKIDFRKLTPAMPKGLKGAAMLDFDADVTGPRYIAEAARIDALADKMESSGNSFGARDAFVTRTHAKRLRSWAARAIQVRDYCKATGRAA